MNLYIRRIPDIKKEKKYILTLEWLRFNLIR
jgi:hypothetical protein